VKVRTDLQTILRDYEVADKAAVRSLLAATLDLQLLGGENAAALETAKMIRGLEEKPSLRLTTGLYAQSLLEAEIETKSSSGSEFEQDFAKHYQKAVEALPWDVVQDWAKSSRGGAQLLSKAGIIGSVKTDIDPAVEKSGSIGQSAGVGVSRGPSGIAIWCAVEGGASGDSREIHCRPQCCEARYLGSTRGDAERWGQAYAGFD
jgi:hypothetical protein